MEWPVLEPGRMAKSCRAQAYTRLDPGKINYF